MKVAFYVTSHGFGHSSRVTALVTEFIKFGCDCYIITDRPKFLFHAQGSYCHIIERQTDTGMIQSSWNAPSVEETFNDLKKLWDSRDAIVKKEEIFLKETGIDLVITDIPFLPIISAKNLHLPVYAITNFDWYFNYAGIIDDRTPPEIVNIISQIKEIYQLCDKSYILPFSNPASVQALPNQIKCGNLAKYSKPNKLAICSKYNIDESKKLALITFGGIMSDISYFEKLTEDQDYVFLTNSPIGDGDNIVLLPRDCDYSLLISSCDVVITKVGYSTLAETCAVGTYLCYATRENFPEDEPLVAELDHYPHSQHFKLSDNGIDIKLPQGHVGKYHSERFKLQNNKIALAMISSFIHENYDNLGAVIDFGTNNSTMLIYSLHQDIYKIAFYDLRITGIGLNLESGLINKHSADKAKQELSIQLDLCCQLGITPHILVTNIGRISTNFNLFQERINRYYNVDWEIISAEREANLGVKSSLLANNNQSNFYNVDIGGSSTEISLIKSNKIHTFVSLNLGILTYYQKFKNTRLNFEQISELIQQDIEISLMESNFPEKESNELYGIGKVFQNLACIYEGKTFYEQFSELKIYELQDFMFSLHNLINHKSKYNYHDYNGKKLNETIFYISLGVLQALNNILNTKTLVVNPLGLELGYLLEKRSNINEI